MLRFDNLDVLAPKLATACGAAAGSVGAAAVMVGDFALQLLGVPLPVVIGSAAGAGLARSFMEPVGFLRALVLTVAWTLIGCVGAPLAHAVGPAVALAVFNREVVLPAGVLAGLGAAIASSPCWMPKLWPAIAAKLGLGKKDGGANA